jgi:hypothetical protein
MWTLFYNLKMSFILLTIVMLFLNIRYIYLLCILTSKSYFGLYLGSNFDVQFFKLVNEIIRPFKIIIYKKNSCLFGFFKI